MNTIKNIFIYLACFAIVISSGSCLKSDRDNPTDPVNVVLPGTDNANYDIFVNAALGDDSNSGVYYEPVATIAKGIQLAGAGRKVAVAEGTYNETLTLAGESIYGGFSDDLNWSETARDYNNKLTIIQDTRSSGGVYANYNPISTLKITGNNTQDTIIEGFIINAGSGENTSAINIDTDTVAGYTLKIINNTIHGGTGTFGANGIHCYNANSDTATFNITIMNNAITDGNINDTTNTRIYGIQFYLENIDTFNLKIFNNTITTGDITITALKTSYSCGISLYSCPALIYNNTINGGDSTSQPGTLHKYGIDIRDNASASICNNIIFTNGGNGNSYGIYETANTSTHTRVDNNNIFDCITAFYRVYTGGTGYNLASIESGNFRQSSGSGNWLEDYKTPAGTGNQSIDTLTFASDWSLSGTPDTNVTQGGIDGASSGENWGFNTDKDGNTRTSPWSMGAYEHD